MAASATYMLKWADMARPPAQQPGGCIRLLYKAAYIACKHACFAFSAWTGLSGHFDHADCIHPQIHTPYTVGCCQPCRCVSCAGVHWLMPRQQGVMTQRTAAADTEESSRLGPYRSFQVPNMPPELSQELVTVSSQDHGASSTAVLCQY